MAVAGLYVCYKNIILAFFIACWIATIIFVIKSIFMNSNREIAFGPYLSMGIVMALCWGENLIEMYLKLIT
ncbi:MAG: hypothetical protein BEN19_07320 [Epulopiscium sp. Nuni2H_MBin003]|nr:MAG: hypothetical protein BEN19_07320 [Epulopiscium sp. Nuni2H_MBin003]